LLLTVTAVFQATLYFRGVQVARLAASQGLTATQGLGGSTSAGRTRADDVLDQFGEPLSGVVIDVTRSVTEARVSVSGRVSMLLPGFTVRVHVSAAGPVSAFRP
jgi:hypothetical protein